MSGIDLPPEPDPSPRQCGCGAMMELRRTGDTYLTYPPYYERVWLCPSCGYWLPAQAERGKLNPLDPDNWSKR